MFAFRNRFQRRRLSLSTLQTALQPGKDKEEDFVSVKEEQTYSTNHSRRNRRSQLWSDYSDLTISCKGMTWPVHKVVVCTQSDFFRNACKNNFKEGKENMIYLEDDDPQVINAMLSFLYENNYEAPADVNRGAFHARVAAMADKYFIEALQQCAERNFNEEAGKPESFDAFPDAITAAYESGNEHMTKTVVEFTKGNHQRLFSKRTAPAGFRELLLEIPEYAAAVAEGLAEELRAADKELSSGVRVPKKTLRETTWFRCPDYVCQDDNVVFSVPTRLVRNQHISCPFKCEKGYDRSSRWWAKYKTANPFSD